MISSELENSFHVPIWKGVSEIAQEQGVNLVTFLNAPVWYSKDLLHHNETLYKQINRNTLDGMISFDFGIPYVAEKLTHFESAANVIINYPRQNYPCLTISQKEIKLVVEHLVKVHNKRKLIYISGNKGNFEAESRLSAFKESVAEYKIDFPPERLFYGNFSDMHCGEKTIDEALEVRHLDFDAVVCANDNMASSAIIGLRKHNLSVPYDVAVTGFDDDVHAQSSLPPLTTVRSSFYDVARYGTQKLIRMLNGETIANVTEVTPTELIIRRSCGCLPESILNASSSSGKGMKSLFLKRFNPDQLAAEVHKLLGEKASLLPKHWVESLWQSLCSSIEAKKPEEYLKSIDLLQRDFLKNGLTLEVWQDLLSIIRGHFQQCATSRSAKADLYEDLFNQARVFSAEMVEQKQIRENLDLDADYVLLLNSINKLITTFEMKGMLDVLVDTIQPNLGIPGLYLVLYEGTEWPVQEGRLILASDERGRKEIGENGITFPVEQLLPEGILDEDRLHDLLVAPLNFGEENLGYIVYEVMKLKGFYSQLTTQISSAVKGAMLFSQRDELLSHVAQDSQQISVVSDKLTQTVNNAKDAMAQITQSMNQVAKGASDQAQVVNQAALSIDQMAAASQKIAEDAKTGNMYAGQAAKEAEEGAQLGKSTVEDMHLIKQMVAEASGKVLEMSQHSNQISTIVQTIEDIASQTNLLALNAAIEAARAGEHGKGFAVVADEVRKLAEKSSVSAKEIAGLVLTIQRSIGEAVKSMETSDFQVATGVAQADQSNQALNHIREAADAVYQRVTEISSSAANIAAQADEMSASIDNIASVSEENTSATEEVNASIEEISASMEEMASLTQTMLDMATRMNDLVGE